MKKLWIMGAVFVLALTGAGCGDSGTPMTKTAAAVTTASDGTAQGNEGSEGTSSGESVQANAAAGEKTKLVVGNTGGSIKPAMVVLAHEMGYYEEEGLDVTLENISSLNDGLAAIDMGKMDVLPLGVIPSITFISQGSDHVIIGGTITEGGQAIVTEERKDEIRGIEDFRGKTVACVRPETGHLFAKNLCIQSGMKPDEDVTFVELDGFQSVIEAVSKGTADVGFVNSGFGQVAEKQGLLIAFNIGDVYPDAVCCRQTTSKAVIAEKRDALVSFEVANLRAYLLYQNDKETTIRKLMEFSGQTEEYVEYCLYTGPMKISMDPAKNRIQEFYEVMENNGDIPEGSVWNVNKAVDTSIYEDALKEMLRREPDNAELKALSEVFPKNNE